MKESAMIRLLLASSLVLLGIAGVSAGPAKGRIVEQFKAPQAVKQTDGEVSGEEQRVEVECEGGRRTVAFVLGDHQPVVPVSIQVLDSQNRLVAEHRPNRDVGAVVWYPERRARYTIAVKNLGTTTYNQLTVIVR